MALANFAAPAASIFKTFEVALPVLINRAVTMFSPGVDPIFKEMVTSQKVESAGFGRDLVIRKNFISSLAGNVEMVASDKLLYGQAFDEPTTVPTNFYSNEGLTAQTYPNPMIGVNPKPFQMTIGLNMFYGNFNFNLDEFRLDDLEATVGEVVTPKMLGIVNLITRAQANMFYTTDSTNFSISGVRTNVSGGATTERVWTFEPDAPCVRYAVGQLVSVYTTASSGKYANSVDGSTDDITCVVTKVDPFYGTNGSVSVQLLSNTSNVDPTWNDTYDPDTLCTNATEMAKVRIVLRKSRGSSFAGLESWLKTGAAGNGEYLLGSSSSGISVDVHPEFKSLGYSENGALTEQKLRKLITRSNAAFTHNGHSIDSFLTTPGVFNAYAAQKIGREQIQRGGGPLNLMNEGTSDGMAFVHEGKTYNFKLSQWSAYGKLYGMKMGGGNWKRYVPGMKTKTQSDPKFPSYQEVEFVAPFLTGTSAIHLPIYQTSGSVNGVTRFIQFPFESRMQWAPDQIPGIIVDGIEEDKLSL